ncbi:two component transcriptional regulator, LytTR family [Roseateles sp. YR242]|uniref:LytR/AlgR family response regulator transcription factor n=1 Tax=Roseateles sp. YR242 TaxID=1855305 RepID=UPI0008BFC3B5|nr:LytTR family DNA-binding domain-containing protein [Roseateles sp. YR242]SEK33733.1 two component transcriptional regulator, LytTR family [Roseateles sp. YR242]
MPTALIAEDEELLAHHLRQELTTLWPDLQVVAMAPHGQAAVDLALQHLPQVCFFDIRMPGMTGLEAAALLADEWPDGPDDPPFPLLVFVTAYDQYALQAFDRAAVDYVLKPVQRERLAQTVSRLQAGLASRAAQGAAPGVGGAFLPGAGSTPGGSGPVDGLVHGPVDGGALAAGLRAVRHAPLEAALDQLRSLLLAGGPARDFSGAPAAPGGLLRHLQVGVGQSIVMLPVDQIVFLEAADKYVRVLTADQEYLVRASLRELLPQLDPERFWQVHRGHVVQVDAIERALRDEAGRLSIKLRSRPERLAVSRMFAHRFKAL